MLEQDMAEQERDAPLRGILSGEVHWDPTDECQPYQPVRTVWEAEGELTPLGRTKAAGRHCADDRGGGFGGHIVFTAANGDTLLATYTFTLVSETPAQISMKMTGQIVPGGTGRFVNATGSLSGVASVRPTSLPPTVESVWPFDNAFQGRISY